MRIFELEMSKQKTLEWLKRYLPAEIAGTVSALLIAFLAKFAGYNSILIAFAGSIGEAIGFYSVVFIKEVKSTKKELHANQNRRLTFHDYVKILTNILLEFGPAGLIDDLIVRPFFMYWFPILLRNFTLGIITGKIAGDICFYFFVIISYEILKKKKNTKNNAAN